PMPVPGADPRSSSARSEPAFDYEHTDWTTLAELVQWAAPEPVATLDPTPPEDTAVAQNPDETPADEPRGGVLESQGWRYLGYIQSGGQVAALVSPGGGPQKLLIVGQEIEGYTVDSVLPEAVILAQPNEVRIRLEREAPRSIALGDSPGVMPNPSTNRFRQNQRPGQTDLEALRERMRANRLAGEEERGQSPGEPQR
ncbi:MAG: hypothetical protein VYC34_02805, partial [Planctomycetota bacterium]|nr:hypothetical protein [Planctomycetota bacterium]